MRIAEALLAGKPHGTLHLADKRIYCYGQNFADDEFPVVLDEIRAARALIMAILCIVFSASLKEPNSKKYIILSCFNIAVALVYMCFSYFCLMFIALSNNTIC